MKRKQIMEILLILCIVCVGTNACGRITEHVKTESGTFPSTNASKTTSESSNSNSSVVEDDYSSYSGVWTTNGASENHIKTEEGGNVLTIEITKNQMKGDYLTIQSESFHLSGVEDISCEIVDGESEYEFVDDRNNTGVLHFSFTDDTITVEMNDFVLSKDNSTGMRVKAGTLYRVKDKNSSNSDEVKQGTESDSDTTANDKEDRDDIALVKTASQSKYWSDVVAWDESNGRSGVDRIYEAILKSDTVNYTAADLKDMPQNVLYVAKNEIYARHGYIFNNKDLNSYFRGQFWYKPTTSSSKFDNSVLNEYENNNLKVIVSILK